MASASDRVDCASTSVIPAVALSGDYARQAVSVSRRRVVEAGFRLARVLAEGVK